MIDILYSFHFNGDQQAGAIKRLIASINSIIKQDVNICICDTSKESICKEIKGLYNRYLHRQVKIEPYCKPKTINIGVRSLVESEYFILSDIDLIYPEHFVESILNYTNDKTPNRVIFHNCNLGKDIGKIDCPSYQNCKELFKYFKDSNRTQKGIAPGNGLVHLKSFHKVNGFDERFIGYGWEDADFNKRISSINKYVIDKSENLMTYHLHHDINVYGIQPEDKKPKTYKPKNDDNIPSHEKRYIADALEKAGLSRDFDDKHPDFNIPSKRQRYIQVMAQVAKEIMSK